MSNVENFFESERLTTVKSSVFFLTTAILFGLPLWWCTTTVYRAELPVDEIAFLLKQPIEVSTNIHVQFGLKDFQTELDLKNRLLSLLDYDLAMKSNENDDCINFKYRVLNTESLQVEGNFADKGSVHIKLSDLEEDMEINLDEDNQIYVDIDKERNLTTFYLGDFRNADLEILISPVAQFIKKNLIKEDVLRAEYRSGLDSNRNDEATGGFSNSKFSSSKTAGENTKRLNAHRGNYDIVFSLIYPETDSLKSHYLDWNIQESISELLMPLLRKFQHLAKFNIASQIVYQMKLGAKPKLHIDRKTTEKYNVFYETDVPHLITPIDRKMGFSLTNNTVLNLVSYVTTTKKNANNVGSDDNLRLFFLSEEKELRTMAFYENWGCIFLHNVELPDLLSNAKNVSLDEKEATNSNGGKSKLHIDATYQLQAFIPNIGKFLGIEPVRVYREGESNFPIHENENIDHNEHYELTVVSQLQLDVLYRRRTLRNIASAVTTIQSLISLCDHVKNMVIRDEIAANVDASVLAVKRSRASLLDGQSILEALHNSSQAYDLAEMAFSDPTILAMLYFPEDQKYAIYVPMFVPMSLPLWSSIGIVIGYWKLKKNEA